MIKARAAKAAVEERYIGREELRLLIPASDMSIWRWQRDPEIGFPSAVKLGADGRNSWWLPSILDWLRTREKRSAQKREAPPSHRAVAASRPAAR
jgi:predicted DNA-binding transcriptional regulator AlpA